MAIIGGVEIRNLVMETHVDSSSLSVVADESLDGGLIIWSSPNIRDVFDLVGTETRGYALYQDFIAVKAMSKTLDVFSVNYEGDIFNAMFRRWDEEPVEGVLLYSRPIPQSGDHVHSIRIKMEKV